MLKVNFLVILINSFGLNPLNPIKDPSSSIIYYSHILILKNLILNLEKMRKKKDL